MIILQFDHFFIEMKILLQTKALTSLANAISGCLRGRDFQNFLYAPRQLMVALRLDSLSGSHHSRAPKNLFLHDAPAC